MICRKCKKEFLKGSEEHIVPDGLGGKTRTSLVFCEKCNNSLSQIDGALVRQFAFARNTLGIVGKRGTVPSVKMTDADGNPVRLDSGGKPVYLKPIWEEKTLGERKEIKVVIPPHMWSHYKAKIEKEYGIKIDEHRVEKVSERPSLRGKFSLGGSEALRAVAKMAYSFACHHLEWHGLSADLSEIEDYIFNGMEPEAESLSLLDGRSEIYEGVDDLSNVIVIHFNPEYRNIIASVVILGSFGYSVLLSRHYGGESCTIQMRNNPVDSDVEDSFDNKPLQRKIETSWLLSRPYFPDSKKWTAMGRSFWEQHMRKVTQLQYEIERGKIIEDCLKQAGFGNPEIPIVTEEMTTRLSECVARRMAERFGSQRGGR